MTESTTTNYPHTKCSSIKTKFKLIRPLPKQYPISSDFNLNGRIHPIFGTIKSHKGVDIVAPEGTDIHSAGDGIVIWTGYNGQNSYGNTVIVKYPNDKLSLYAHLQKINVKSGILVFTGECIGTVGCTGASSGSHLHYEIIDGKQIIGKNNKMLKDVITYFDSKKPDVTGKKPTGIPPSVRREDPKLYFNED